ncbi:MAG: NAD(+) diphosphatase [Clostridium perfringens]|nr:NAD(+) diphosphatase [Clostridium perfringens]
MSVNCYDFMKNNYEVFKPVTLFPKENNVSHIWFIFKNNKLLLKNIDNNNLCHTKFSDIESIYNHLERKYPIGSLGDKVFFCGEINSNLSLPNDLTEIGLREAGSCLDEISYSMAGKAFQILDWDSKSNFCGRCGSKTEHKDNERAKICPNCNLVDYPRTSPAIIVAIVKDHEILLAHNTRFKDNMYSLIAGFVDCNETLEDCVRREVFEEVGIKVKNIKYINSQSWPFPNSLMVGFLAEYDSGEIKVDGVEIGSAAWFNEDNFPTLPPKFTIARKIIDKYIENKLFD